MSREKTPCEKGDAEMWHVDAVDHPDTQEAKRLCKTQCPQRAFDQCFILGEGERYGVWGGTDARERGRVKYRRELAVLKGMGPAAEVA